MKQKMQESVQSMDKAEAKIRLSFHCGRNRNIEDCLMYLLDSAEEEAFAAYEDYLADAYF